ncbi:helix-turn-helix transcriptional regulator [Roseovarius sp. SK2]|uniref:helix-turn-helix domain-containing protein n=1 Tax=Roseovarius TaxID=74030 RepID=UPI00237B0C92|nr:helix-turn-helix transcriptional regulator [Roseovarius sp. SK2]MDD9725752.1 helix-turn-helix transcriptional regulator [Roseovarius sp. SK2]
MNKQARATIFRDRLTGAMTMTGTNLSALARQTGVSRSTVSQLLDTEAARMPNAHLAAGCAEALGVSSDWLLGLTDRPERPGDVIEAALSMTQADRTSADAQLLDWHREASGYKIRHVPATLPDMLKTEAVMHWEYAAFLGKTPGQAVRAMQDNLDWLRREATEYEIAMPRHELEAFARGTGYWQGLDRDARREQILHLVEQAETFFPSLRLNLFDAHNLFSAPVTLFGPLMGVIYVGRFYLAFREPSRLKLLSGHMDWLIREAVVDARDAPGWIAGLTKHL